MAIILYTFVPECCIMTAIRFFPKGRRDEIKNASATAGESLNSYIKKAVAQRMDQDNA